jgi:hypothetical protein
LPKKTLVELPPDGVAGLPVELLRVVEKVEGGSDDRGTGFQPWPFGGQVGLGLGPFLGDRSQARTNLCNRDSTALGEVEEVVFLGVQVSEHLGEVLVH